MKKLNAKDIFIALKWIDCLKEQGKKSTNLQKHFDPSQFHM
jgi:hypothetical protein